jgi:ABC-2 type transport system permease protein
MKLKALGHIFSAELYLFCRNYMNLFFAILFPVLMIVLFGSIYGNEPSKLFGGHGTMDVSTAAYCALVISVTGIMSLPVAIANYREKKILKRFMATPIRVTDILIAQFAVNFAFTILGVAALGLVAKAVYNVHFFGNFVYFVLALLLSIICIFSIGMLIGSVSSNVKQANTISYCIFFPMLFLSGATVPIELFPDNVKKVAEFIPLTYIVEMLKGVWLNQTGINYFKDIIILLIITIVCTLIAIKLFKWE